MKTGIKYALESGAKIIVKIDSDGQMSPDLIPSLINPIKLGKADLQKVIVLETQMLFLRCQP